MKTSKGIICVLVSILSLLIAFSTAYSWSPTPVKNDPLVRMPGTQPPPENNNDIEAPTRCTNCHGGFNSTIEPAFNWQGSMMAQASRDFLFWACMTTAAQDSIWAVGTPNAVDICERCHFPKGWVEGRSDPPNASLMTGADFDGVHCDVCHSMYDPFFATTSSGTREGADWLGYWDESNTSGTPSANAASTTLAEDSRLAATIKSFNGTDFFANGSPALGYLENGSGQMFLDDVRGKRGSFADASARHTMFYSRYHKSKYMCSTCHDVSNPVLANLNQNGDVPLTTETQSAYSYYHVERTFSEFMLSAYGQQGGSPGIGPFAPEIFTTSRPGNVIAACQDCHMRDGVGPGASQRDAVYRPTESTEHPKSGQPIHDLTGGNAWVSTVLASAVNGSPNYDPTNGALLNQGAAVLTLDLNQGLGINPDTLLAGADRAMQQLQLAASINNLSYKPSSGVLTFQVQNQTGHKLISGFPEGRRMFINIKGFDGNGNLFYEVNPYDESAATLKGLGVVYDGKGDIGSPSTLNSSSPEEVYDDTLVYEMKPASTLTNEDKTFHFALATGRYKDNRIPPKGFRISQAAARISVPVHHGVDTTDIYTSEEYAGGYDDVIITIPTALTRVDVTLYYQTTSREYIEFLRDEINGYANSTKTVTLTGPGAGGDPAYLVQGDPFFSNLKAWGDTIWQLWLHNRNVATAAPFVMATASYQGEATCTAPIPTLLTAAPSSGQVDLAWSNESAAGALSYSLYNDQAGKAQLVANQLQVTSYTDSGLTNGTEYCYKVTSSSGTCESGFSNIICTTPSAPGQTKEIGATLTTGRWETTGKGGNKTTVFVQTDTFIAGDGVVVIAQVLDQNNQPARNATVNIEISGPETAALVTGPSDTEGIAEATWNTTAPNKRGQGGTPAGSYSATVTNVSATGFIWDGVGSKTTFTLE